ncbi:hypothetical protein C8J56DRAFT_1161046 [Mycena floridula]|nr:hypothetical protein C8J56DRAFT_1161046 [Mycena floridula]
MLPTPPSPGVGLRRKGPKNLPTLPSSAFQSPPNSGVSERFPVPPSPSTVHPEHVYDANVVLGDLDLSQWKNNAGSILGALIGGVVLSVSDESKLAQLESTELIVSVVLPFTLDGDRPTVPSDSPFPISRSTVFTSPSHSAENLKWALEQGRSVDIDIQAVMSDEAFDGLEDLLCRATEIPKVPAIVISNWLPPPHDLDLPIVKLMNHQSYRSFQARTAALSLFPELYIKFLPPAWNMPTPTISPEGEESKEQKEWKRRIKMFLGPVMEAFGYQRIIFGSSPSNSSTTSNAGDWYLLAKECLAELGVEQDAIDAVFYKTAKKVYGVEL